MLQRSSVSKMNTAIAALQRSGGFALNAFVAFLFRPSLEVRGTEAISRKAMTLWLLVFSFAATALFAILAFPLIFYADAAPGEGLRAVFDRPVISMIVMVVILGPLVEEVIFRGWLTGTVRAFAGSALFLTIWFGGTWLLTRYLPEAAGLGLLSGLAAAGFLAFIAVNRNKGRNPAAWYRSVFPFVFWGQGLLFGGLHLANISSESPMLSLIMTAPLVICGWLWGYARIKTGFGTAWMLHMAYNLPAAMATMAYAAA